ncbi:hypothetical protein CA267_016290 [Alteromonas pelagimontana]|uniref:Uncharacterized protein n=1 Tax=Alteromonas pelagimontana TaxID=1858656 RepID=A0A6M4MH07_9ALTE|nr:hypothetical protein [Alteromonas pelagimontana]QJR82198.1 hypothetical protein CA267_016290 [Alteromonas pelagimontana]
MEIKPSLQIIRPDQAPPRSKVERVPDTSSTGNAVDPVISEGVVNAAKTDDALNSARTFQQQSGYDQPEGKGQEAVTAYLSLDREAQRENVRQLLGVDIFA